MAILFGLNLNLLYLQSTPMTEPLFLAALAALLWATLWFRDSQSVLAVAAAAAASNAASLTRYEGWFLIPFVCLYILVAGRRKWHAVLFGALASLGPLAWLAHNQYYFSNALEFYNGPWSAMAIYRRQLAGGMTPYPGDHDWRQALHYYFTAARLTAGPLLLLLGVPERRSRPHAGSYGPCCCWPSPRSFTFGACTPPSRPFLCPISGRSAGITPAMRLP